MPIYEYVCENCGKQFEFLLRGQERPSCPECGHTRLTRNFSAPAAHTGGSSSSAGESCPVRESCGMSPCCGQSCNLAQWQG
jgi:putative FmdB family regulatory protein